MFGLLVFFSLISLAVVSAQNIGIELDKTEYVPGEEISFKITLYDENAQKIDGELNYEVRDYFTNVVGEGVVSSGQETKVKIPEDATKGLAEINAKYNEIEVKNFFNILELDKIDITLEGEYLVIINTGNVDVFSKQISIYIGDHVETALVNLAKGQEKRIRLTGENKEYDVRVVDVEIEEFLEFKGVSLTGNVVGLETVSGFWKRYPMVGVFLGSLVFVEVVIFGLKYYNKIKK